MEYCFLTGFLVVLLIQRCKSEGHSTSIQSSTAVPLQDGPATPQEPEPAEEVVPAVAPPSLKEVQQAVQEASEQVETRGAEEVLKVLLERVVEAAWGQVEATGEVKADEEAVREEALEPEKEEVETNAEVLEKVVEGEDVAAEGEYNNAGEEQEVAVVDALEYVSEEGEGVEEREGETTTGPVEETGVGVEAEGVEVINKSLGIDSPHRTVEDTVAAIEETGEYTLAEAGARVGYEDVLSEEKGAAETERREVEETPAVVEVAGGGEAEAVPGSNTSLASADVQQIGDVRGNEDNQVDEMQGGAMVPHSDDLEIESTQTVVGEHVEEINIVEDAKEPEVEDQQGHLVVGGVAAQDEGAEAGKESPIKGESVELVNKGGDLQAGEEEQRALETSHGGEKEDQEVLLISAPEAQDGGGASVEPSPENQAFTPGTFLGEGQPEENALGEEAYNNGNEIINPTDDLLPHGAVEAQPAPDHSVKVVLAEPPQAEGEEPGEANELVEEAAGNKETGEQGLEPWKIGAISAAAFLVLETIIIIVYVLKCRNKNSTAGIQRACEEGCVEPEDATGGDCSDDKLPASNGDAQQIAALDAFEAASTPARNKEQKEEERGVAMADLPPSSAEESACSGPGPDPSQDLRTSTL